jgi:hypothetical protein
MMTG